MSPKFREYEALRRLADTAEAAANEADALRIHEEHLSAKARRALTQIELARQSGVKQSHISAIKNGRRAVTTQTLVALAKALGAPLGVLAGQ